MKKLMHFLFLSCKKASELIEKKMHFRLSAKEKMQLKMHKIMCNACSLYEKQSELLEKSIQDNFKRELKEKDMEELKNKINKSLKNN
mgnify:CR=1 FL=1